MFCDPKSRDVGLTVIAGLVSTLTAVPESATTAGPLDESLEMVREPVTVLDAPDTAGTKATWITLLSPGGSVAGTAGAEITEKFEVAVNAVSSRLKLPELVTATDCEALALPAAVLPKSIDRGATLIVLLTRNPEPVSVTVCGLAEPLCEKLRIPGRVPAVAGANTT